jgi:hypothetical protein
MNLNLENAKISQAFEAFQEAQLDRRTKEILHNLGIPLIMPEQTTLSEIQRAETINCPIQELR